MHPVLFEIGSYEYRTYGAAIVLGLLVLLGWARLEARWRGLAPWFVSELGIVVLLGAVIGGRLWYLAENASSASTSGWRALVFWEGGMSSAGSILAALAAGTSLAVVRKQPVLTWLDAIAPGCALGQSIFRLGCFSAGCCWGKPSAWPWAVIFTDPRTLAPRFISLHPTQILLAGVGACSFLLLLGFRGRLLAKPGGLMGLFAMAYASLRLPIETLRAQAPGPSGSWAPRSIFLGLLFFLGLWLLIRNQSKGETQRPVQGRSPLGESPN